MHIHITSDHIKLTTSISKHIHKKMEKLGRLLPKLDTSITSSVEIAKTTNHHQKGDIYRAEINLHTAGKIHRTESVKSDIQNAFDDAAFILERELIVHYGKKATLFKKGAQKIKKILKFQD